jgi:hypothetical protein
VSFYNRYRAEAPIIKQSGHRRLEVLKKLSNLGEERVYRQIAPVADRYGAEVFRKIRVADVVDISKLRNEFNRYALMAHFDFVVANKDHVPHFAVEFDGPGHSTKDDAKKDEICREADLALFCVNLPTSQNQIGELSFLNYLTHLWFLGLKFEEMRATGELPPSEAFMISGFLKPNAKHIFDSEFNLLGPARGEIIAFCKRENIAGGALSHFSIGGLLMQNDHGEFAAFCSFPIENIKLYGRNALGLKIPNFGLLREVQFSRQELEEYCMALAIQGLLEQIKLFHAGSGHIVRREDEVWNEVETLLERGFTLLLSFSGSDDELVRFAHRRAHVMSP